MSTASGEQTTPELPICGICGLEMDEARDYTSALTCSYWACNKNTYHTDCVGDHQRGLSHMEKGRLTGYLCPRGNGKVDVPDKENPCKGKIQATHHKVPTRKKKHGPPPPFPAAAFPTRPPPKPKQEKKPSQPANPPKPKPISHEQILQQVQARREATRATQGESVLERLRGGQEQRSIIPGMEFEEEKKKPAKKKSKAKKAAAPSDRGDTQSNCSRSTEPRQQQQPLNLQQLPNIARQTHSSNGFVSDVNIYNLLIGDQYYSEEEEGSEEEGSEGEGSNAQFNPAVSPSPSDLASCLTTEATDPWGGVGSHTPGPGSSQGHAASLSPALSPPPHPPGSHPTQLQVGHGVVYWGSDPSAADAVFDFQGMCFDAGVPEEVLTFMSTLPDNLCELYLSELHKHMSNCAQAADAAAVEHQRQAEMEDLQVQQREREHQAAQALAAQQQQAQAQAQQQAQTQAFAAQQRQLQHQQAVAFYQQQQQLQPKQMPPLAYAPQPAAVSAVASATTPVAIAAAPAATDDGGAEDVDDLLALCLGE